MKKELMTKYCEDNNIFVPNGASKKYLCSAIVRFFLNEKDITGECFGFWENENSECMCCDHKERCRDSSIGMEWREYEKKSKNKMERI